MSKGQGEVRGYDFDKAIVEGTDLSVVNKQIENQRQKFYHICNEIGKPLQYEEFDWWIEFNLMSWLTDQFRLIIAPTPEQVPLFYDHGEINGYMLASKTQTRSVHAPRQFTKKLITSENLLTYGRKRQACGYVSIIKWDSKPSQRLGRTTTFHFYLSVENLPKRKKAEKVTEPTGIQIGDNNIFEWSYAEKNMTWQDLSETQFRTLTSLAGNYIRRILDFSPADLKWQYDNSYEQEANRLANTIVNGSNVKKTDGTYSFVYHALKSTSGKYLSFDYAVTAANLTCTAPSPTMHAMRQMGLISLSRALEYKGRGNPNCYCLTRKGWEVIAHAPSIRRFLPVFYKVVDMAIQQVIVRLNLDADAIQELNEYHCSLDQWHLSYCSLNIATKKQIVVGDY